MTQRTRTAAAEQRPWRNRLGVIFGGLAILAIGFFSWITDLPLMFPALGPSSFELARDGGHARGQMGRFPGPLAVRAVVHRLHLIC